MPVCLSVFLSAHICISALVYLWVCVHVCDYLFALLTHTTLYVQKHPRGCKL